MLRFAMIVATVASVQALGSAVADKAAAREMLRKKTTNLNKQRDLAACNGLGDWDCTEATTCRKANENAEGSECLSPSTNLGDFCEDSEHCAAPMRCFESVCQAGAAPGEGCVFESEKVGFDYRYPLRQCDSGNGYCNAQWDGDSGTCVAFVGIGGACNEGMECDISKAHCDTSGGVKTCTRWLANDAACTSNGQCGGSNPPDTIDAGYCDDQSSTCKDIIDQIGDAVTGFFTTVLIIIVVGLVCCITIIYFACCRKRNTVVVVQGGAPAQ